MGDGKQELYTKMDKERNKRNETREGKKKTQKTDEKECGINFVSKN